MREISHNIKEVTKPCVIKHGTAVTNEKQEIIHLTEFEIRKLNYAYALNGTNSHIVKVVK